jgi:hypothetical protein
MSTKFNNLRNDLEDLEKEGSFDIDGSSSSSSSKTSSKVANYILLFAFLTTLVFYAGSKINFPAFDVNPIEEIAQRLTQPSEDVLNGMGSWMEEMGYGTLSKQELIDLREKGVTATFTSQVREAGFTDVTLDELVDLKRANVSASFISAIKDEGYPDLTLQQAIDLRNAGVSTTFTRMMKELGYHLSVNDLLDLEQADVTAYLTSNLMDLGYTKEELTKENLIRLVNNGVSHQLAKRLIDERGSRPTIDELIRYKISNQ